MKSFFNACFYTSLFLVVFATITPARSQPVLNGAWKIVEVNRHDADGDHIMKDMQPSLVLFQDGYYSIMALMTDEERPGIAEGETFGTLSDEKLRAVVIPFWANSGRYEIKGSTLFTTPIVAKSPSVMNGSSISYTFRMEGSDLRLLLKWDDGVHWEDVTLVRME